MTKTTRICDKCKKEVSRLYSVPEIQFAGDNLIIRGGHKIELCKNCMHDLINVINTFHNTNKKRNYNEIY